MALFLRLIWLWWPQGATIFDEAFYVNAARVLLSRDVEAGQPYAGEIPGLDPNTPHPPLAKVLIAGSIELFGDGGIGWRVPSVAASMVAFLALFGIVRRLGGSAWLGALAVFLLAADNLWFIHSRIGTLDMLFVAPTLVAAWLALGGRWAYAGVVAGIATLVKLTALFGLGAIVVYELLRLAQRAKDRRMSRGDVRPIVVLVSAYAVTVIGGLWLLDLAFSPYRDPFSHIAHMLSVGVALQAPTGLTGIASYPWQWPFNVVEIPYFRLAIDSAVNGVTTATQVTMDFRGALNPVLLLAAPFGLIVSLWLAWRDKNSVAMWALAWTAATYLPYYPLAIVGHRITYLYYFLPVVPAIAVMVALVLTRSRVPWMARAVYIVAVVAAFVAYFPFRQVP